MVENFNEDRKSDEEGVKSPESEEEKLVSEIKQLIMDEKVALHSPHSGDLSIRSNELQDEKTRRLFGVWTLQEEPPTREQKLAAMRQKLDSYFTHGIWSYQKLQHGIRGNKITRFRMLG